MPIESPILDDLTYAELQALLVSKIPTVAPEWTDHNPSDPGITLIQLFGYLAEQVGYRLNRVPDKNYVEFLKLVGIKLRPARAAGTLLEMILSKPETADALLLRQGAEVRASIGDDPPTFETDADLDLVPAQLAALVSTRSDDLRRIPATGEPPIHPSMTTELYIPERFSLAWDGKRPKLKDMPTQPVATFARPSEATHRYLWLGLAFNPSPTAGFIGQRVTLHVQIDDDDVPDPASQVLCGEGVPELLSSDPSSELAEYRYYRPPQFGESEGSWRTLNVLSDTTEGWTQSGQIRLDVPFKMGAVPDGEWRDARGPYVKTTVDICAEASGGGTVPPERIAHPLIGAVKNPVSGTPSQVPISGWIAVEFTAQVPSFSLRAASFNVVSAHNAKTVATEILGRGNARPGQLLTLANGNVLGDSLVISVEDATDGLLHVWERVESFDTSSPEDRVYVLDPEAGEVLFGDGRNGKPPELRMRVVASRYRHGGGAGADLPVGAINKPVSLPSVISDALNIVSSTGGRDAETLDEAKKRAPGTLQTRDRAVTADDFKVIAMRTAGVNVRHVEVVPLAIPFPSSSPRAPGLDLETEVPGALSLIVVPDRDELYPSPTESELRAVCRYIDQFRLITTEVHLASPMYVRLFDLEVIVSAAPGVSRTILRERIAERLETAFHVHTGGPSGEGFGFGSTLHHADLVAEVFRTQGVERVESVTAFFDSNSPTLEGAKPMSWRPERAIAQRLTACVADSGDRTEIDLLADETVFVDVSTLNVVVRTL